MKMHKRFLSLTLAFVMILGSLGSLTPVLAAERGSNFSDVEGHWAADYIKEAVEKGLVKGFEDESFKPQNKLTRAEMATILVRAFDLEREADLKNFKDVNSGDWFFKEMARAVEGEIFKGDGNRLMPKENIRRDHAFTTVARALKLEKVEKFNKSFPDLDKLDNSVKAEVAALVNLGIVEGDEAGKLNPAGEITRAEMAKIISSLLEEENDSIDGLEKAKIALEKLGKSPTEEEIKEVQDILDKLEDSEGKDSLQEDLDNIIEKTDEEAEEEELTPLEPSEPIDKVTINKVNYRLVDGEGVNEGKVFVDINESKEDEVLLVEVEYKDGKWDFVNAEELTPIEPAKPVKFEIVEVKAKDARTILVTFKGLEGNKNFTEEIKVEEMIHGENKVRFEFNEHNYSESVNYVDESLEDDYINYWEREPNDYIYNANRIYSKPDGSLKHRIFGSITDNYYDIDYYRIDINRRGRLDILGIWLDDLYKLGLESDLGVGLVDVNGDIIETSFIKGYGRDTYRHMDVELEAGTYYIMVIQLVQFEYIYTDEFYGLSVDFEPYR